LIFLPLICIHAGGEDTDEMRLSSPNSNKTQHSNHGPYKMTKSCADAEGSRDAPQIRRGTIFNDTQGQYSCCY